MSSEARNYAKKELKKGSVRDTIEAVEVSLFTSQFVNTL